MLQSILFFILGFLCSGFLALMVAPAIWRRAVVLTRKRIEASTPLSLAELQADKDRMRAELAMTIRRLEMSVKSLREKSAAQTVELSRGREELKRLAGERDERSEGLSQHEAKAGELAAELESCRRQVQTLAAKLAEAEQALEARARELDRAGRLCDEANFAASSRQIELVARESEVEKLSAELAELGNAREAAARRHQELAAENLRARQALQEEARRAEQLGRELGQLREKLNGGGTSAMQAERQEIDMRGPASNPVADVAEGEAPLSILAADRDGLQERLTAMVRENRRLLEHSAGPGAGRDRRQGDALLREQMNDLAAEVIRLAAQLDGPGSPIAEALAAPPAAGEDGGGSAGKATSLADRVRALQRAASAD